MYVHLWLCVLFASTFVGSRYVITITQPVSSGWEILTHLPQVRDALISVSSPQTPPPTPFCQRYSAPQSPINVIILRPFERSRTTSISARSASESLNLNTLRLSSGCSETPRRVPFGRVPVSQATTTKQASRNEERKRGGPKKGGRDARREKRTHRRGQRQRTSDPVPTGRRRLRWSHRRGGRRFSVIWRGAAGTGPSRPTLA